MGCRKEFSFTKLLQWFLPKMIPTKTADFEHLRCEKSGITDFAETVNFLYYYEKLL